MTSPGVARREVEAAGARLALLEVGEGPPVVLLHGFPDNAWTWDRLFGPLSSAGHRVVAPYLPGFPPSGPPPGDEIVIPQAVEVLAVLLEGLAHDDLTLVGHDWGATLAYALAASRPDLVARAAMIAVPHPAVSGLVLGDPALIKENFHHWFFQLPDLPETAVARDDLAFVDYLWDEWSSVAPDRDHVQRVKRETYAAPAGLRAAIDYYRAMYRAVVSGEMALAPITVPSLVVFGGNDPHQRLAEGQEVHFTGEYRFELVDGARHFVQRERPAELSALLLEWPAGTTPSRAAAPRRRR